MSSILIIKPSRLELKIRLKKIAALEAQIAAYFTALAPSTPVSTTCHLDFVMIFSFTIFYFDCKV